MSNAHAVDSPLNNGANATVAANIRGELGRLDVTQSELAHYLGLSEMAVSRRMKGYTEFSSTEIQAIADYFGMTPGDLFAEQQRKRRTGGGTTFTGENTVRRGSLKLVGPEGLEPPASSVKSRELADVIPFPARAS